MLCDMDVHDHLAGVLRDQMVFKGLSQNKLARLAGIPQANLSAIINGKAASEAMWQKLFDAVNSDEAR